MSKFIDSIIAYRILRMLTTPFVETEAYRLGIIDDRGRELKKMRDLNSTSERDAYTLLHRMVFRLKRIIEKVPAEGRKLASYAAALALIKESLQHDVEPIGLESRYIDVLSESLLEEETTVVRDFFEQRRMLPFRLFIEEAPVNNAAATPGVAGFTPDTLGVRSGTKKTKVQRRGNVNNVANIT